MYGNGRESRVSHVITRPSALTGNHVACPLFDADMLYAK